MSDGNRRIKEVNTGFVSGRTRSLRLTVEVYLQRHLLGVTISFLELGSSPRRRRDLLVDSEDLRYLSLLGGL